MVGEDKIVEKEKKTGGRVSSTYPPTFRAKPQESYAEWKRAVEFWIGGEGSQLPPELESPLIKQVDKHKVHEHRRRLMQHN